MILIVITGELERLTNFDNYCFQMIASLIGSCLFCVVLNASYFISTDQNSSLFTIMCGNSSVK